MGTWSAFTATAVLPVAAAFVLCGCGGGTMHPTRVTGPAGALAVDDGGSSLPRALRLRSGQASRGDPPVVFVHSLAGNARHWTAQLEHLRPARRSVALDFRGHGRSEAPKNGDYSIAGMVGDIEAVVDTLGLQRIVLVGHSMGGGVALSYAGAHPERVAGLLLVDPIGDGKQIPDAEVKPLLAGLESKYDTTIQEYWTGIAGPDSAIRKRLLADLRATPRETVVSAFREVLRFDPDPALARYRGPTLSVVTPYNDQPFSLHRLGKGFPHRMVQGTGHWVQLDKPEELNRILDEFLETTKNVTSKR
jgi:pimeloyl-ACP methyl ester carboxylesterase